MDALDPVALARALHARFDIRSPRDIKIELIAYHCGPRVLHRNGDAAGAGSADARLVRSGSRAIITIAREAQGTPRGRFSLAHELGHDQMHRGDDSLERLHGAARLTPREFRIEREANRFASLMLVPTFLAAPLCALALPTLDAVGDFAREFEVSLTVAAKRWAELAHTGCAFVESKGGIIKRVVRSGGFRGVAVERRKLEEGTLALEMGRAGGAVATRVHDARTGAWGSAQADREVTEACVPLGDGSPGGPVLTWLWHG